MPTEILNALRRITHTIDLRSRGLLVDYGLTAPLLLALQVIAVPQPVMQDHSLRLNPRRVRPAPWRS